MSNRCFLSNINRLQTTILSPWLLALGLLAFVSTVQADEFAPGAAPGTTLESSESTPAKEGLTKMRQPNRFFAAAAAAQEFETTVYTFNDITIFSYFDGTEFTIFNAAGDEVSSDSLDANQQNTERLSQGTYRITANKSFTILVGDAVSSSVQGFFAVDQSGRGTSTLLNTLMVNRSFSTERFIVFGYQSGTEFSIRNLTSGELLHAGSLREGQHYDMPNPPHGTFLQVSANKPVSALSYGDQDYYVPSANGTFAGETFYGFSGYTGNWTNSITVTAYQNDTQVTITNTETDEVMDEYTLGEGRVNTFGINTPTFWKVSTSHPVTVANIPFSGWTGGYAYMTRAIDQSGSGTGTLFYVPTIGSRIDIFSFAEDNKVKVTKLGNYNDDPYPAAELVAIIGLTPDADGFVTLEKGDAATFNAPFGQTVYKVESTERVSVLQSNNSAGADFMPLNFALELPDLMVSTSAITLSPENTVFVEGDSINVTVDVKNIGVEAAENVLVNVYEGDPEDGVIPLVASKVIALINAGGTEPFSFDYSTPKNPGYRKLVVKIDPNGDITEANSSNNQAEIPLLENEDLLAPLALYIEAEDGLQIDENGLVTPNPFTIKVTMFNVEATAINNVVAKLSLLEGLTLLSPSDTVTTLQIPAQGSVSFSWEVAVDSNFSGFNRYDIQVTADDLLISTFATNKALDKTARRAINVPDKTAPAKPQGLKSENGATEGSYKLSWNANTEFDLSGYILSRLVGTEYQEVSRGNLNEATLSGLTPPVTLALQSFDSSNNISDRTDITIQATAADDDDKSSGSSGGQLSYWMILLLLLGAVSRRSKHTQA